MMSEKESKRERERERERWRERERDREGLLNGPCMVIAVLRHQGRKLRCIASFVMIHIRIL